MFPESKEKNQLKRINLDVCEKYIKLSHELLPWYF